MKKIKGYLITFGIGLILALLIVLFKDIFHAENAKKVFHILSDAFFVPGVLIAGFGLLVLASNGGTFDMLTYGIIRFFTFFKKDLRVKHKTFYEYRTAQQENPRKFLYLVLTGLAFIVLSVIFLLIYLKLNGQI